ncbi:MAG TPA: DUF4266 domain-containing protein [Pseudomonadota bacterium]|jgi:hypothetical protein|nr:DUF4266 domain-containing protein [Pseudomonadota bacterium]
MTAQQRLVLTLALAFSGCARVPAYQRETLAHPTMLLVGMAGVAESHIYAIQEGASGGGSGAEGGCGCN